MAQRAGDEALGAEGEGLLECPLCGGEARLSASLSSTWHIIECLDCGVRVSRGSAKQVRLAWCRRAYIPYRRPTPAAPLDAFRLEATQPDDDTYGCGHSRTSDRSPLDCPICATPAAPRGGEEGAIKRMAAALSEQKEHNAELEGYLRRLTGVAGCRGTQAKHDIEEAVQRVMRLRDRAVTAEEKLEDSRAMAPTPAPAGLQAGDGVYVRLQHSAADTQEAEDRYRLDIDVPSKFGPALYHALTVDSAKWIREDGGENLLAVAIANYAAALEEFGPDRPLPSTVIVRAENAALEREVGELKYHRWWLRPVPEEGCEGTTWKEHAETLQENLSELVARSVTLARDLEAAEAELVSLRKCPQCGLRGHVEADCTAPVDIRGSGRMG